MINVDKLNELLEYGRDMDDTDPFYEESFVEPLFEAFDDDIDGLMDYIANLDEDMLAILIPLFGDIDEKFESKELSEFLDEQESRI